MRQQNGGVGGGTILTPNQMQLTVTQFDGYASAFAVQVPTGPSSAKQCVSFGTTMMEFVAGQIAGQVAGEFAAGMRQAGGAQKVDFSDEDYVAGVATLAVDLAEAVLLECQERVRKQAETGGK